jgi:hypothetical protein
MGPGTGVAEAGAIVCCADAVDIPAATTMAAAQTLCKISWYRPRHFLLVLLFTSLFDSACLP